jgi:hypothetical protein
MSSSTDPLVPNAGGDGGGGEESVVAAAADVQSCSRAGIRFPGVMTILRYTVLILSLIALASMLTVCVFAFIDSGSVPLFHALSPVYVRGTNFVFAGFYFAVLLSLFADGELFDLYTAVFSLPLALVGVALIQGYEDNRWVHCGGAMLPFDFTICTSYPNESWIMPVFSGIVLICLAFTAICLLIWFSMSYHKTFNVKAMRQHMALNEGTTPGRVMAIVSVLQLIPMLVVGIWAWVMINNDSFYHGIFLVPTAIFVGIEFAHWGRTPPSWNTVSLIFLVIAIFFLIFGSIYEFPRFWKCYVTFLPDTSMNNQICSDDPVSGGVVPVAILYFDLFAAISFGLVIWRYFAVPAPSEVSTMEDVEDDKDK